jgi:hypothetical protein
MRSTPCPPDARLRGQRRRDEVAERDARLHDAAPARDVELDQMVERPDVDPPAREAPVGARERHDVVHAALVDVRRLPRRQERAHLRRDVSHARVVLFRCRHSRRSTPRAGLPLARATAVT